MLFGLIHLPCFGVYMMATDKRRNSAQYWEDRLKRMDLDADRGRPSWLSYGHEVAKLDTDGRKTYVSTAGDEDFTEWPLSLL